MNKRKAPAAASGHSAAVPSALLKGLVPSSGKLRSEGTPLVTHRMAEDGDSMTLGLDLSKAPVPPRRYAAEMCAIEYAAEELRLIFGQSSLGGGPWDTAVVIRMNPRATRYFNDSLRTMGNPTLAQIAELSGITAQPLSKVTERPHQTANMVANFVGVAVSGHETCLDFYHANAFAMRNLPATGQLEVEPVVRVDLRTSIFMTVVDQLAEIVKGLPPDPQEAHHG